MFQEIIQGQESWDDLYKKAENFLNTFIAPKEFAGLVFFEEEHPLMEREELTG